MLLRRLVRRYRSTRPGLADRLLELVRQNPGATAAARASATAMPVDTDTRLHLINETLEPQIEYDPVFSTTIKKEIDHIILERKRIGELEEVGLIPSRSALFTGPPGVGKTLAAKWIARELELPLLTLDLSAVMSSFLGRTGTNVKRVLSFAKEKPCVLLIDELDAVAKRRDDAVEIGELKRLVTVLLQEVDQWGTSSLLLAASNHPDLLDPAIWRRFDITVDFHLPEEKEIRKSVNNLLRDFDVPRGIIEIATKSFEGRSFSEIEKVILMARRRAVLDEETVTDSILSLLSAHLRTLPSNERTKMAIEMVQDMEVSQRRASEVTGVSRDTIRKHTR
jgi:SpoVK/Ycf46/Vps4 family AAA+-type ATPase